jgi:hypothetical protein
MLKRPAKLSRAYESSTRPTSRNPCGIGEALHFYHYSRLIKPYSDILLQPARFEKEKVFITGINT